MRSKRNPRWRDNGPDGAHPGAEGSAPSTEFNNSTPSPDQNTLAVPAYDGNPGVSIDDDNRWWDGATASNLVEQAQYFNDLADSVVSMEHYMLNNQGEVYTINVSGQTKWCSGSFVTAPQVGTVIGSGLYTGDTILMAYKTVSWAGTSFADPGAGSYNINYTGTIPTIFGARPWSVNSFNIAYTLSLTASAGDNGRWANFRPPTGVTTEESQGVLGSMQQLPVPFGMLTIDNTTDDQFKFYVKFTNFANNSTSFSENEHIWPLSRDWSSVQIKTDPASPFTQYTVTRASVEGNLGPFFIDARGARSGYLSWPNSLSASRDIVVSSSHNAEGDFTSGFLWDKSNNSLIPGRGDIEVEFMIHAVDTFILDTWACRTNNNRVRTGQARAYNMVYPVKTGIFVRRRKTHTYSNAVPRFDCYMLRIGSAPFEIPVSGSVFSNQTDANTFITNYHNSRATISIVKLEAETFADFVDSDSWDLRWQYPYLGDLGYSGKQLIPNNVAAPSGISYTVLTAAVTCPASVLVDPPVYRRTLSARQYTGFVGQPKGTTGGIVQSGQWYIDWDGEFQDPRGTLWADTTYRTKYIFRAKGNRLMVLKKAVNDSTWTTIMDVTDNTIPTTTYPGHYGVIQRSGDPYFLGNFSGEPGGSYVGLSNVKSRLALDDESLNLGTGTVTAHFIFTASTIGSSNPIFVS
jgi:hypothetical protein